VLLPRGKLGVSDRRSELPDAAASHRIELHGTGGDGLRLRAAKLHMYERQLGLRGWCDAGWRIRRRIQSRRRARDRRRLIGSFRGIRWG
jgi:hypothetical protein